MNIKTQYPVAVNSYDHIYPYGTIQDNYSNTELVQKLKNLGIKTLLDIGCAGGAFVEELILNGIESIGIEGSDINLQNGRAAWATIPKNLFTADVTKPFTITKDKLPVKFDVITAWEFFEHIEESDLGGVMENIDKHTRWGSQLICSVSNFPSPHMGVDLHRTKKNKDFWIHWFETYNFIHDEWMERYYEGNVVRNGTFNFMLRKTP